jgi:hypothetical protein
MPRKTTTAAAPKAAPAVSATTPAAAAATPTATAATPAAAIGKSATTHLFARTKEERRSALTHEQIENDLAAFARAGGEIEVLGTTFTFKSIGPAATAKAKPPIADAAKPSAESQDGP